MRVLISVRCAHVTSGAQQADEVATFVASIVEAADATDDVHLVFDAALGEAIEVIRNAAGELPPQRTRVWGGTGDSSEPILGVQAARDLRLRRCIAELEPEAMIDICLGESVGLTYPQGVFPKPSCASGARFDHATVTVQAVSEDRLEAIRDRLGIEMVCIPDSGPSTGRALSDPPACEGARDDIRTRGDSGPDVAECHLLAAGPGLDGAVSRLLRSGGHVQLRSGALQALSRELSLDTTLQLAHACGGYASVRSTLMGEALTIADVEAWLASVSRGARAVTANDAWYEHRRMLDAALFHCLGDAVEAPGIAGALHHDILGAVAGPRRLLVDISALVKFDAKSGIQRVVRNILSHLESALPERYQIAPIAFMDDGRCLHASRFYARFVGLPYDVPDDGAFVPRPGDIFLGLDLSAHIVPVHQSRFEWMRRLGIPIHFVVYDLLPIRRPECFDPRVVNLFQAWYASIAVLADGVLCISRAVADEFADWLDEHKPKRIGALGIDYFHLGADIVDSAHREADSPHPVDGRRYVLMVSTLEPRKGYAQALAAFELLWAKGTDLSLVIVGKQGWMMEALVERLRGHPELGRRLHWFEGIDDALLASLYQHADGLLSASEGEGFGLPLIEAAQYGVPVLCRDLPVFREIAGEAATYFDGYEPEALADAIAQWNETLGACPSGQVPWKTWREATSEFVAALTSDQPYRRWIGNEDRYLFSGYNPRLQTLVGERSHGDIVTSGREGVLVYGPYMSLGAGSYRLRIRGELSAPHIDATLVEVVAMQASLQVAAWHVIASEDGMIVDAEFRLPDDVDDLEVRLTVSSEHAVRFSRIEIVRHQALPTQPPVTESPRKSEERVQ
ncbi:glycosyltransferase family 4 protein [Luteimonas fraxinea]|uniref:glycosyltransferase family 4 protein n=1 Tax=Luteimonas fraxinea TaxID=2901869 RepID=UPI001E479F25|nr:glycosyltransferase family 1 protein [Luteimonas fraxinea]UHH09001.1 glycosyltransferase family 4 protein [Luteimonas fraxinea]